MKIGLVETLKRYMRIVTNSARGRRTKLKKIWMDDVFLCSYPRSGNTWLRYLLGFYREPSFDWDLETIETVVPDLHKSGDLFFHKVPRPRIIKSHFLYNPRYPKVVYLVRDGRDVCVSYYEVQTKINGYQKPFDDFVLDLCTEKIWPSSWQTHVMSWVGHKDERPLHIVRYEDLLAEPEDVLLSIVQFIGLDVSRSRAEIATQKASLQKVWEDHQRVGPHRHLGFSGGISGKAGKWREVFSSETEATFLRFASEAMERCGYV